MKGNYNDTGVLIKAYNLKQWITHYCITGPFDV